MVLTLGFSAYAAYPQLTLSFADIRSPAFSAKAIQIRLTGQRSSQMEIRVGEIVAQGRSWRNLRLSCNKFQLTDDLISCASGELYLSHTAPFPIIFRFIPHKNILEIEINPAGNESWQFSMRWNEVIWHSSLTIANGQVAYITPWLPDKEMTPILGKGKINGVAKLSGGPDGITRIAADLLVDELAFSDRAGLRAGENINVAINANAKRVTRNKQWQWQWQGDITWQRGEVFWQPFYFEGNGCQLSVNGTLDEKDIHLLNGKLALTDIGELDVSGLMKRSGNRLRDFELHAQNLELSTLFDQLLKPFLAGTVFAEINVAGQGSLAWRYRNGANKSLVLDLYDTSVVDERGGFSFQRINAHIPWKRESATMADVSILSGQILQIPLGPVRVPLEINGSDLRVPQLVLPILDGALELENFIASHREAGWQWQFSGELLPVSMDKLTEALQIAQMHGTLSGVIPEVSHDGSTVTVDGTLLFNVFGGAVVARNLTLLEPMGLAPHLKADLEMRNIDLDLLTRTFSFGNIQGRVDIEILNLELVNWEPVKFDASLFSSPGTYPRRISQAAVENISSLGGASAVAAIQRSFLRFFEEFGYSKIGWRCSLRNNVCRMSGIEPKANGYLIIKGGGIPSITVMGYNRDVSWQELINRLKRVTHGNDPIIQ